jgi:tRNA(Ile)-lysidine synthase
MDVNKIALILERECRLERDQPILVGVSGGPDSLCLLSLLARLPFPLLVAHFDHQLRAESAADSAYVAQEAKRLGLPFLAGSQDVARFAQSEHFSIEEAARVLRYRFLFAQAKEHGAQAVAVGHTADDQVETVLMHLLRGAGLAGLRGMEYRSVIAEWDAHIPLIRPLLSAWRKEIVEYCAEQHLSPLVDASNQDPAFLRNRLRHALIPYLESYNPQIRSALWRMSDVLAGDEAVVRQAAAEEWSACLISQAEGSLALDLARLRSISPGLLRAVLRKAIITLLPGLRDVDYAAIERARSFILQPRAGQLDLVQDLCAFAERENLVIQRRGYSRPDPSWPQVEAGPDLPLAIPGSIELPAGWRLSAHWVSADNFSGFSDPNELSPWEAWIDADQLPGEVCLRPMRQGDRFQPLGMQGHSIKLSDFWINAKLSRRARAAWPLVVSAGQIIWIPGFRLAHAQRLQKNTRKALHLQLFRVG